MKQLKMLPAKCICLALFGLMSQRALAQTFWQDNFENATTADIAAGSTRTPSNNAGTGGPPNTAYFKRSSNTTTDISLAFSTYTGMSGSFIWAGENHDDLSGTPGATPALQTIEWTNINISGKSGITFKGLFAANIGNLPWDNGSSTGGSDPVGPTGINDYLKVEYAIDAGAYTQLFIFTGDNIVTSKSLKEDTNGDGIGDGTQLNATFTEITKSIAGTGSIMKIRLSVFCNGNNEEWAADNFRLSTAVLPIELASFTSSYLKNKSVELNWVTLSEKNNAYFDIERSLDGKQFSKIGRIAGHGTVLTPQYYSFIDEYPFGGINYYRLKQFDNDNTYNYSTVISVQPEKLESGIKVFPTFVQDILTIENNGILIDEVTVYNQTGKMVLILKQKNQIDMSEMPEGIYFIKVQTGGETTLVKVFKL